MLCSTSLGEAIHNFDYSLITENVVDGLKGAIVSLPLSAPLTLVGSRDSGVKRQESIRLTNSNTLIVSFACKNHAELIYKTLYFSLLYKSLKHYRFEYVICHVLRAPDSKLNGHMVRSLQSFGFLPTFDMGAVGDGCENMISMRFRVEGVEHSDIMYMKCPSTKDVSNSVSLLAAEFQLK